MAFLSSLLPLAIQHGPEIIGGIKSVFDMFHGKNAKDVVHKIVKRHFATHEGRANTLKAIGNIGEQVASTLPSIVPPQYHKYIKKSKGSFHDILNKAGRINEFATHIKM